jgi:hypothetical protein
VLDFAGTGSPWSQLTPDATDSAELAGSSVPRARRKTIDDHRGNGDQRNARASFVHDAARRVPGHACLATVWQSAKGQRRQRERERETAIVIGLLRTTYQI